MAAGLALRKPPPSTIRHPRWWDSYPHASTQAPSRQAPSNNLPRHIGFDRLSLSVDTAKADRSSRVCGLGMAMARTVKFCSSSFCAVEHHAVDQRRLRVPEDSAPNQPSGKLVPKIPDTARKRQRHFFKTEKGVREWHKQSRNLLALTKDFIFPASSGRNPRVAPRLAARSGSAIASAGPWLGRGGRGCHRAG